MIPKIFRDHEILSHLINYKAIETPAQIEKEIQRLLLKKDRIALEYLYDQYSSSIYKILIRIVGSEKIAEDLLQEVFIYIWNNTREFQKTQQRIFTRIFNIARNLAIAKIRTLRDQDLQNSYKIEGKHTSEGNTGEKIIPNLTAPNQEHHVLTNEEKLVIDLLYFKGYTIPEIAKKYELPMEKIKSIIQEAIKKLRTK